MKYPIGTKYRPRGKHHEAEVIDYYVTYNSNNDIVSKRYVARHKCLGCDVIDRDVVQTTIDRALS